VWSARDGRGEREGKGEVRGGWLGSSQCCQVDKIPAKKLKRG
jgi:hypothetical protein